MKKLSMLLLGIIVLVASSCSKQEIAKSEVLWNLYYFPTEEYIGEEHYKGYITMNDNTVEIIILNGNGNVWESYLEAGVLWVFNENAYSQFGLRADMCGSRITAYIPDYLKSEFMKYYNEQSLTFILKRYNDPDSELVITPNYKAKK
jgi:hypothetical protein